MKVTGAVLVDTKDGSKREISADGAFIYVGILPQTKAFLNLGITDDEGWIVTNEEMETKLPGIFAVGDVRQKSLRQVTTAVGDGGQAGQAVFKYIEELMETLEK